jgi:transcription elongation factor GreA
MVIYLSRENFEKLKKELEYLKSVKRKEISEKIKEAVSLGDISENAEFDIAMQMKADLEQRIQEIESILENAVIIRKSNESDVILPGVTFEAINLESNKKYVFTLVTYGEADPLQGKISLESPLGKAFFRKRVSSIVEVDVNGRKIRYKVTKIIKND